MGRRGRVFVLALAFCAGLMAAEGISATSARAETREEEAGREKKKPPVKAEESKKEAHAAEAKITGRALSLDGKSYAGEEMPYPDLKIKGNHLTVEAWVKVTEFLDTWNSIVGTGKWGQNGGYGLTVGNGGGVSFILSQFDDIHQRSVSCPETTIYYDTWYHIAGVLDGREMRIYVNGMNSGRVEVPGQYTGGSGAEYITVGGGGTHAHPAYPYHLRGEVDEVRISNVARYQEDFKPSRDKFEVDGHTVALYHFDETAGEIAYDSSANKHHLKLSAAAALDESGRPRAETRNIPELDLIYVHHETPSLEESGRYTNIWARIRVKEAMVENGEPLKQEVMVSALSGVSPYYPKIGQFTFHASADVPVAESSAKTLLIDLDAVLKDLSLPWKPITIIVQFEPVKRIEKLKLSFDICTKTADGLKIIKTLEEEIEGGLVGFVIPGYTYKYGIYEHIELVADIAQRHKKWSSLPGTKDMHLPEKIIFGTDLYVRFSSSGILKDELTTLRNLGLNSLSCSGANVKNGEKIIDESGFSKRTYRDYAPGWGYLAGFEYIAGGGVTDMEKADERSVDEYYRRLTWRLNTQRLNLKKYNFFVMADEPHWSYSKTNEVYDHLRQLPNILNDFHGYLRKEGRSPKDFGRSAWTEVALIKQSEIKNDFDRKLFYHAVMFVTCLYNRNYAYATRAIEKYFNPDIITAANWNNWHSRIFSDDGKGNVEGAFDWLGFGRERGATCLWTEDRFDDDSSYAWSYYADLLRSGAQKGGLNFGGYIIPTTCREKEKEGIKVRTIALIGYGAKVIHYWSFGPDYAFNAYAWSEWEYLYRPLAEAIRMVGKIEDVLYPAKRPSSEIAVLVPLTSHIQEAAIQCGGEYVSEAVNIYYALRHENYPVDFISEGYILDGDLEKYKALYITGPAMQIKAQKEIKKWVANGGTLWASAGAGEYDEYARKSEVLNEVFGTASRSTRYDVPPEPERAMKVLNTDVLDETRLVINKYQSAFSVSNGKKIGAYDDGSPAVVLNKYGKGRAVIFGSLPATEYMRKKSDRYPAEKRALMISFAKHINRPVILSKSMVDAPILESPKGKVITLLNYWRWEPMDALEVTVKNAGKINSVESVELGKLNYERIGADLKIKLPLEKVDFIVLR